MSDAKSDAVSSKAASDTLKELADGLKELKEQIASAYDALQVKKIPNCAFMLGSALGSITMMIKACEHPMTGSTRVSDAEKKY